MTNANFVRAAEASFSGAPDTIPSAIARRKPDTHWSSYYAVPTFLAHQRVGLAVLAAAATVRAAQGLLRRWRPGVAARIDRRDLLERARTGTGVEPSDRLGNGLKAPVRELHLVEDAPGHLLGAGDVTVGQEPA